MQKKKNVILLEDGFFLSEEWMLSEVGRVLGGEGHVSIAWKMVSNLIHFVKEVL